MADAVPFGKYKGRPVEDMLADTEYMAWLEAQPWFRERFSHLVSARDADAMSRTPVHNRLQALFLDQSYRAAFAAVALGGRLTRLRDEARERAASEVKFASKKADDARILAEKNEENYPQHVDRMLQDAAHYDAIAKKISEFQIVVKTTPSFEFGGCDVHISLSVLYGATNGSSYGARCEFSEGNMFDELRIEIKPSVADEYPAVLRQMRRNKSAYLFVGEYVGEGATESQFVEIFAASGKRVVFKRDVDAALELAQPG